MMANDSQKSQLTFALYGLILTQFWRRVASKNKEALVPYTSLKESDFIIDFSEAGSKSSLFPSFPCDMKCQRCIDKAYDFSKCINLSDACTQTLDSNDKDTSNIPSGSYNKELDKLEPLGSRGYCDKELSDREQFYLAQIESLQKERKVLREVSLYFLFFILNTKINSLLHC